MRSVLRSSGPSRVISVGTFFVIVAATCISQLIASCRSSHPIRRDDASSVSTGVPAIAASEEPATTSAKAAKAYVPDLDTWMSAMQVHHAKLWFAGEAANWRLVERELTAIESDLSAVREWHPTIAGATQPTARSIDMFTAAPRAALRGAIAGKDSAGFREGFDALTAACNTCHQTYGQDAVRLTRPTTPPLTNQSYGTR